MLTLHIAPGPGETHVALLKNGVPIEYLIHRPGAPDGLGDLHWARVLNRVPAMAGAFVALPGDGPLGSPQGFLPDTEGGARVNVGDHLAVVVTRAALGHKGPRVSARLTDADRALAGAGAIRKLRAGPTPMQELQAAYPAAEIRTGTLPDALAGEIEALADAEITLPGGMRGTIVPTPALTAIDLDMAAASATHAAKPAAQFAANLAVLPELARQIRLRNLSGAIMLDFAGLATRKRLALRDPLAAALAADRLHPTVAGFSALGFAEISRPRFRPPLHERLAGAHAAGLSALRRAVAESAAAPSRRLVLHAAPTLVAALQNDPAALAEAAHAMAHKLALRSDPALAERAWRIEDAHG